MGPRKSAHLISVDSIGEITQSYDMASYVTGNAHQLSNNQSAMTTIEAESEQQLSDSLSTMESPPPEDQSNPRDSISIRSLSPAASSTHSVTSTLGYADVESFADFKPRVEKLCETLWPPPKSISRRVATRLRASKFFRSFMPSPQQPLIERLKGGDYNRITSITLPSSYGTAAPNFVLRTPRWAGQGRPDRDVSILDFVRKRTSIPVPKVVAWDFTSDNALGKPYVIQQRVLGSDVNLIWGKISHVQRCTIACELGSMVKSLLTLESPRPGLINAPSTAKVFARGPEIVPFDLRDNGDDLIGTSAPETLSDIQAPQTTGQFFKTVFRKRQAHALSEPFEFAIRLCTGLYETVCDMDNMGMFSKDQHCFCHVDLHSRNIMAEIQPDDTIKLTAVLDWDEAVFAPKFVNCQPPWWLWEEEGDDRVDEKGWPTWPYELPAAKGFPATPEKQELKRLFEEHAGPEYQHLATDTYCRLGRGLFILAREGLVGSQHYGAAEKIIQEWKDIKESLTEPKVDS